MYWVAYRGKDTGFAITLFPDSVKAGAERMHVLLQGPAEHQDGEVSDVFEAGSEEEAKAAAPGHFPPRTPRPASEHLEAEDLIALLVEITGDQAVGGPISASLLDDEGALYQGLKGYYRLGV